MTIFKDLYVSVPGITSLTSINIQTGHGSTVGICTINCESTTLTLNSQVTVDLGYTDNHAIIFRGRVKSIDRSRAEGTVTLVIKDMLIDAVDYFLVADNPDNPYSQQNISAENLVGDLLNVAHITDYTASVPLSFTFGINVPVEFNLISIMDAVNQIANILSWSVYSEDAMVYFKDVKPYWRSGNDKNIEYGQSGNTDDPVDHSFCNDGHLTNPINPIKATIKTLSHVISDENLRNRITVYGRDTIHVSAYADSPYLPVGFYKTSVIASPLIDSLSMATSAAQFNLGLYNRLTENVTLEVMGDPTIKARQFCEIKDSVTETDGKWFINTCVHTLGAEGYTTRITCTK